MIKYKKLLILRDIKLILNKFSKMDTKVLNRKVKIKISKTIFKSLNKFKIKSSK